MTRTRNNKKILAIIPARSGSKGIKNKNIRNFCGRPLMYHTIREAKKARGLDRVIVSTDSPKYAKIAKQYGVEVPFFRPKEHASDMSPIIDTVIHILDKLKKDEGYDPEYVMLLQTTSPLRDYHDIEEGIRVMLDADCDTVMSMCSTEQFLYTVEDGHLKQIGNPSWIKLTNRQALPETYKINGPAVLIAKSSSLKRDRSFIKGKIKPIIMEKWKSTDLDEEEDFTKAEIIYRNRRKFIS